MAKKGPNKELTPRQRAFIAAYTGEAQFNGTKAARIAGYSAKTDNSLAVTAYTLLRNIQIRAEIDARISEMIRPANEVLARLGQHARASLADVLDDEGQFSLREAKRRGTDGLIKKLKVRRTTRRTQGEERIEETAYEYELHDVQAALIHLGRYHKLFTDKQEVTGQVDLRLSRFEEDAEKAYGDRGEGHQSG